MSGFSGEHHVAVIGGGITGLSAVDALLREKDQGMTPPSVTLLEADERLGGKIRSEPIGGQRIDVGAESLMARAPTAIALCEQLGLSDDLTPAAQTTSCVWIKRRLAPLPTGVLAAQRTAPAEVLRSGILSKAGAARAALDLLLPSCRWREDETVAQIVRRRLGAQALERIVDPLLGTIYGANCEQLSAAATAPALSQLAHEHRSLIAGLLRGGPTAAGRGSTASLRGFSAAAPKQGEDAPADRGPLFVTLEGGLERIVTRLAERCGAAEVRLRTQATAIERRADGRYLVRTGEAEPLLVDAVIVATGADVAANLLRGIAPGAAGELQGVRYASTVVVTLRCKRSAALSAMRCAGLLMPRSAGTLLGACTFMSVKWPHLAVDGGAWLRCSIARAHTAHALEAQDGEIVSSLTDELRQVIGEQVLPEEAHIMRWHRSLPICERGHIARVARIEQELEPLRGIALAGAAYHGAGVPQCIADGQAAARRTLAQLRDHLPGAPIGAPS